MGNSESNDVSTGHRRIRKAISLHNLAKPKSKDVLKGKVEPIRQTDSYLDGINGSLFAPRVPTAFTPEFQFRSDISSCDFQLKSKLGEGTFSTVYKALWLNNKNAIVAIKIQNKDIILEKNAEKQIKRESAIHKLLSESIYIPKFFECWQTATHLFSVMQCVDGIGDLYTLWQHTGCFSEDAIRIYAAEIGLALDYLQNRHVVYRDLKLENVALDSRRHIKLIDFGFSRCLEPGERAMTICGTLQYMAPEVATSTDYGFEVDWWCYGVVLYVLSESEYPFPNGDVNVHTDLTYSSEVSFTRATSELASLIAKLLHLDPNLRLSCLSELMRQPLFPPTFSFESVQKYDIDPVKSEDSS
uniref:Protein kinase domain-containing protein n=1 Tax=Panagrellus redivivus TaxID=6233 RepID=A0A7E4VXA2_PANRE